MPTWGKILNEVNGEIQKGNQVAFDYVRKKYVSELQAKTGRNLIVYASKWTAGDSPPNMVSINDEDIQAFMEAISGLKGDTLDLILHTPGGSAEATDAIVSYLRQKFKHIRVIIPQAAMSAGTMLACAADEIIMGKQSSIGPIDPQFILNTANGQQSVPAHAIIDQFKKAQEETSNNPKLLQSWLPILGQYGPALIIQCKNQIQFSKQLVEKWLKTYMLKEDQAKATSIAEYLSSHDNFKTHGKHINIIDAKALGLKISDMESDQDLQDKILSVFHAVMITFHTAAVKLICNHNGNAYVKQAAQQVQIQPMRPGGPLPGGQPAKK
jgi:ATP-dependent protease ClpP protease subunit